MLEPPLHPAFVHFPVTLSVLAPFAAAAAVWFWRRGRGRAPFAVVAALQLVLAAGGIGAMLTGHRDEGRVEKVVGEKIVGDHEDKGEDFAWTAVGVAAVSVALLLVPARLAGAVAALLVLGTLADAALAFRAAKAGGDIVYRHGGAAAWAAPPGALPPAARDGAADADEDERSERR